MIELSATYYDGKTSIPHPVRVRAYADGGLFITGEGIEVRVSSDDLRISPRLGDTVRSLALRDGAKCETTDNDAVDAICALYGGHEGSALRHRLEQSWRAAIAALASMTIFAVVFVVWGIPFIAEQVAMRLPDEVAYQMGKGTLDLLDKGVFEPSALSEADRAEVKQAFDELAALEPELPLHLEFRKMGLPNAFALPDGTVVVTDELVALARRPLTEIEDDRRADRAAATARENEDEEKSDGENDGKSGDGNAIADAEKDADESAKEEAKAEEEEAEADEKGAKERGATAEEDGASDDVGDGAKDEGAIDQLRAVLAHEVGHVKHRHGVRMAIESSSIALIISVYIGDATQLSTILTSLPAIYAQAGYSRDHETEADLFALALMRRAALSPRAFSDVMRKLQAAVEPHRDAGETPDVLAYLSSHPPTEERIARFEAEEPPPPPSP